MALLAISRKSEYSTTVAPAWRILTSVLLAGTLFLLAYRLYTGLLLEDAFITFRYARNLALGHGFVYNLGEHVCGTTSPLHTLLLGFSGAIFGIAAIPTLSNVLMFAATIAAALMTFLVLQKLQINKGAAILASTAFLIQPDTLWTGSGGMETPLVVLLMALSLWVALQKKYVSLAFICAALLMTRVDTGLWIIILGTAVLISDRKGFFKVIILSVVFLLPWFIFSIIYFGSLLPNTIAAKHYIGEGSGGLDLVALSEYLRWAVRAIAAISPLKRIFGLILFAIGAWHIWKLKSIFLQTLVIYPFVFSAAMIASHAPRFPWYLVPVEWCSLIVGIIGLWVFAEWVVKKLRLKFSRPNLKPFVIGATIALSIGALLIADWKSASFYRRTQINQDGLLRAVGGWLHEHTLQGSRIAMEAIGYQGYFSERDVLDLAGLVTPDMVAIRRNSPTNAAAFDKMLRQFRPDYVVLRSFEVAENRHYHGGLLFASENQRTRFARDYSEVKMFVAPLPEFWGEQACVSIYQRRTSTDEISGE